MRALETNQVSTVIIPYDAIAELKKGVRTIVLPYVRFVPADAMERLAEFAEAEGSVIVWATDDTASQFEAVGQKSELNDWRRWPKMESYAGTVRYRTTLKLSAASGSAIALDAGRVEEIAELTVNGKRLGARIYPPYRWDITAAVRKGENEITLDVTNTAFARWKDSFSHGDAVSGLLGPVRILRGK